MMRLTRVFAVATRRAPVRAVVRPSMTTPKLTAVPKLTVAKTGKPAGANSYARFYSALCKNGAVRGRHSMRETAKLWRATGKVVGVKNRVAAALKLTKRKGGVKAHTGMKGKKPKSGGKKVGKKVGKKTAKTVKTSKPAAALRKAMKKVTKKVAKKKAVKKVTVSPLPTFH
ncbi:uncharacterized protein TM35_000342430 [Trypanosoma theileri]|uniref:Uncharacterized protein n=1 Tax=Trypanosoma theileri TaxID=67003 RepID=A0A1X0NM40_9TRYP|nr:uncharacterized protein TM35_000342430 [Trypanosoma theileri]ORC85631.1 hypothetical protein TM35_000342430 [Trypanosoma theileri]